MQNTHILYLKRNGKDFLQAEMTVSGELVSAQGKLADLYWVRLDLEELKTDTDLMNLIHEEVMGLWGKYA